MSVDKLQTEMNVKLKALSFRVKKTDEILAKQDREASERHESSISSITSAVNNLKENIEEKKFSKGESEEEVEAWGRDIEEQLSQADDCKRKVAKLLKEMVLREQETNANYSHQQKIEFELQLMAQKTKQQEEATARSHIEQLEFEQQQIKLKLAYQQQSQQSESTSGTSTPLGASGGAVKLPKLVITKFNGTPQDWLRFWGQFSTQIDQSNVHAVTKFSYLKELIELKVRKVIDGLPFTEEGYERAKAVLEKRYGQTSEVVGAYVRNILELPTISERKVGKIHDFYERLLFNVESLETLGKLKELDAAVRFTLDKLGVIKSELAQVNEKWQEWTFKEFLEALQKWTVNNPIQSSHKEHTRAFHSHQEDPTPPQRSCVYCESKDHKALNCDKVVQTGERKRILSVKLNCTSAKHRAADCRSSIKCQNCDKKHHTSICGQGREQGMTVNHVGNTTVIHPVVVVKVAGKQFRALLDSGASHSYASATFVKQTRVRATRTSMRQIAMLMGVTTRKMQVFNVPMASVKSNFLLNVEVTKVEKKELLTLENPLYRQVLEKHAHLRGVVIDDDDARAQLPVHLILGANDYAKIRTSVPMRVGRQSEPVAEFTHFGWALMSPGAEMGVSQAYMTLSSNADYERLCTLDVLGLPDSPTGDQDNVYAEFREQLTRDPSGWYETGLPWKGNHPPLPNNRVGSLRRLETLVRKLRNSDSFGDYDAVIQEQLAQGVVEKAPEKVDGKEFYIPHRAVLRETAESTKLRVVYDASARAWDGAPSLNECLHTGPALQNQLWSVLSRGRFHPVAFAGDVRKAFLQVRIREGERDALRFHWVVDEHSKEVQTLRFTRALFGLAPSPFLLGGVIEQHLESWHSRRPESVREIKKSLYVDDVISGAETVTKAKRLKAEATEIFADATLELHKWHSNEPELESNEKESEGELSFAKQQLGSSEGGGGCKLLGLPWDKINDTVSVVFPSEPAELTKRGILTKLAKVYDPLGIVAPVTLEGKFLYRDVCQLKMAWDAALPESVSAKWKRWESGLPEVITIPRSLVQFKEQIEGIHLHAFGDASGQGVAAAVYAVVDQRSGQTQGLVAAKARLAKQGLTIPRLELVSGHMAANLLQNTQLALDGFPVVSVHGWLDSSVALHWIGGGGDYKQFVRNRVAKIQEKKFIWRHVPTKENPADLGSRGGKVQANDLWWQGPEWLGQPELWPPNIVCAATKESEVEARASREIFGVAIEVTDCFDAVLAKFGLRKALRVCAWISRFVHNSRQPRQRVKGPLTTEELNRQRLFWVKRAQGKCEIQEDTLRLNLQVNEDGVLECRGRIQGEYPIYLPDTHPYTMKVIEEAHGTTLHGGVGLIMAHVREKYWVPRLRRLTRKVIKNCYGCRRFQAVAVAQPPPGNLPKNRTQGDRAFQVIGMDYAGPLRYRASKKKEAKAYILLYACSLTRGLYLDLLPNLEMDECLRSLKSFIARRGRPERIYSDNGRTFVGAAKWIKQVMADEKLQQFLAHQNIEWQFNLSRAPWWGGQFERMVGLVKKALHKVIGNGSLMWQELQDLLLDVEVTLNNRPLCYLEDDVQMPVLTPNAMLFQNSNLLPELQPHHIEQGDLRKRARYLSRCKDAVWCRWTKEYLRALRERHNLSYKGQPLSLSVGDVVIIRSDEKNRGKWPLGIVLELFKGRDGVTRSAKLRAGKTFLERAVQHLYPLELSCDRTTSTTPARLNPDAPAFRSKRAAAIVAGEKIREQSREEQ